MQAPLCLKSKSQARRARKSRNRCQLLTGQMMKQRDDFILFVIIKISPIIKSIIT